MQAAKKAYSRKMLKETEGMTTEEKKNYVLVEEMIGKFEDLARELENKLFPERYDMVSDSIQDSKMRKQGKNPMSAAYTEKVNTRRQKLGFMSLGKDGLPVDSTMDYCKDLITKRAKYNPNKAK